MTSSLQYGYRTFTARVTFRERSHTIVLALDGRLSCRKDLNEYLHALPVTGSYVEAIDAALALANYEA